MNKTLRIFSHVLLLFMVVFVAGCSRENPKSVAQKFLSAAAEMNYQEAKKYSTPSTGKLLDMLAGAEAYTPDSVKKKMMSDFTIMKEYSRTDSTSIVLYHLKNSDTDQILNLVKRDGKWLVNISKEELNTRDAEPPVEVEEDRLDSLAGQK
jgi:hypothetical protein